MKLLIELKRLASAVQLRPWPPHFKAVSGIAGCPPSPLSVRSRHRTSSRFRGPHDCEELSSDWLFFSPLSVHIPPPHGVLYWFFIIGHDRRRILHFNVTRHPITSCPAITRSFPAAFEIE